MAKGKVCKKFTNWAQNNLATFFSQSEGKYQDELVDIDVHGRKVPRVWQFTTTENAITKAESVDKAIGTMQNLINNWAAVNDALKRMYSFNALADETKEALVTEYRTKYRKYISDIKKEWRWLYKDQDPQAIKAQWRVAWKDRKVLDTKEWMSAKELGILKQQQEDFLSLVDNVVWELDRAWIDATGLILSKGLSYGGLKNSISNNLKIAYLADPRVQAKVQRMLDNINDPDINTLFIKMKEDWYVQEKVIPSQISDYVKKHRLNYAGFQVFKEDVIKVSPWLSDNQLRNLYRVNVIWEIKNMLFDFTTEKNWFFKTMKTFRELASVWRFTVNTATAVNFLWTSAFFWASKLLWIKNAANAAYIDWSMDPSIIKNFIADNNIISWVEFYSMASKAELWDLDWIAWVEFNDWISAIKKKTLEAKWVLVWWPQTLMEWRYASKSAQDNFILACKELGIEGSDELAMISKNARDWVGIVKENAIQMITDIRKTTIDNINSWMRWSWISSMNWSWLSKHWYFNYLMSYTYRTSDNLLTWIRKMWRWIDEDWFTRNWFLDHLNQNPELMVFVMTTLKGWQMAYKLHNNIHRWDEGDEKRSKSKEILFANEYFASIDSLFITRLLKETFKTSWLDKVDNILWNNYSLWSNIEASTVNVLWEIMGGLLREASPVVVPIMDAVSGTIKKNNVERISWKDPEAWSFEHFMKILVKGYTGKVGWLTRFQKIPWWDNYWLDRIAQEWDLLSDITMSTSDMNESMIIASNLNDLTQVENILNNDWRWSFNNIIKRQPIINSVFWGASSNTSPASVQWDYLNEYIAKDPVLQDMYDWRYNPRILDEPWMIMYGYRILNDSNYYWKELLDWLVSNVEGKSSIERELGLRPASSKDREKLFMNDLSKKLGYKGTQDLIKKINEEKQASLAMWWKKDDNSHILKAMAMMEKESLWSSRALIWMLFWAEYGKLKKWIAPWDKDMDEQLRKHLVNKYMPLMATADLKSWQLMTSKYIVTKHPATLKWLASDEDFSRFANWLAYMEMFIRSESRKGRVNPRSIQSIFSFITSRVTDPTIRLQLTNQAIAEVEQMDSTSQTEKHSIKLWIMQWAEKDLVKMEADENFMKNNKELVDEYKNSIYWLDPKMQAYLEGEANKVAKAAKDKTASSSSSSKYNPFLSGIIWTWYRKWGYGWGSQYGQNWFAKKAFDDLKKKFPKSAYTPKGNQSSPYIPPKNLAYKLPWFNVKIVRQLISAHTAGLVSKQLSSWPVKWSKAATKSTGKRVSAPKPTPKARRRAILTAGKLSI